MLRKVTVIGDGQLARMMQTAAVELGIHLRILAGEENSSAAQVIPDSVVGDYHRAQDCLKVAESADAVTFEHEHVPGPVLQELVDKGFSVQPAPEVLLYAQDKLAQRKHLQGLGAPVPPFAPVDSVRDAVDFWEQQGGAVCLKACRGGYDGKGVWFPDSAQELEELVTAMPDTPLMVERKVDLSRELSVLVARRPSGEVKAWPVTMSVQEDGVCAEAIAPAPGLAPELARRAHDLGMDIATKLGVTGVLAVELFVFRDANGEEDIAVNELAMRPHNTGHWTQDGCVTSQFEQHLRAVTDLPLGDTRALAPVTVMANYLGAEEDPALPLVQRVAEVNRRFPEAKIHLYGKDYRAGRKLGHVNIVGTDVAATRRDARLAAGFLARGTWADGKD